MRKFGGGPWFESNARAGARCVHFIGFQAICLSESDHLLHIDCIVLQVCHYPERYLLSSFAEAALTLRFGAMRL